jgi:hypothetical protein
MGPVLREAAAAGFYQRHGFVPAPEHPMRLYRRMRTSEGAFSERLSYDEAPM